MRLFSQRRLKLMISVLFTSTTVVFALVVGIIQMGPFVPTLSAMLATHPYTCKVEKDNHVKFVGDYRKDLKAFMKRSKVKDDSVQRVGAIVDLCMLHHELVNDPRYKTHSQLQSFRAVAADRLKKCRKEIEIEIKRFDRRNSGGKSTSTRSRRLEDQNDHRDNVEGSRTDKLLDQHEIDQWLIEDMQSITQISGGPVRLWNYTGGNHGPGICDYGPDLVRLIESTINPDFWRTNGGTGIIEYYQPLRILVVSASSQVHDQMTDMLRTLRANSR